MEVYYSSYRKIDTQAMKQMAKCHHLKLSGGSDFHGDNKPLIHLGTGKKNLAIPYSVLEQLRQ
ncbi:PHP domain protein [gut metagenome]|uniref:PHP domain protein n=1 Tax=gut metagenome TaxID=749906 RepID=J9FZK1_9ZZZZ